MFPVSQRRIRLVCLNNSTAGRKLNPATQGCAGTAAVPLDKECCLVRNPYSQSQTGEGNLWLGQMRPSQFHQMSGQHIIVGLNLVLMPYFDYFEFVEVCFMAQDVVYLGLCSSNI